MGLIQNIFKEILQAIFQVRLQWIVDLIVNFYILILIDPLYPVVLLQGGN